MDFDTKRQAEFFSQMSERQISAREFFSGVLLDSLSRSYGLENGLIMCFDTKNRFLSWTDRDGVRSDDETHPYEILSPPRLCQGEDIPGSCSPEPGLFQRGPQAVQSHRLH